MQVLVYDLLFPSHFLGFLSKSVMENNCMYLVISSGEIKVPPAGTIRKKTHSRNKPQTKEIAIFPVRVSTGETAQSSG